MMIQVTGLSQQQLVRIVSSQRRKMPATHQNKKKQTRCLP
jgi:hypothetical protein